MAHFAKLDENNVVVEVIVIDNSDLNNLDFPESEPVGLEFIANWRGETSDNWKQTSYNGSFRKCYAIVGKKYEPEYDAFVPESPYGNWIFNHELWEWEAPVPCPGDEMDYQWDEQNAQWVDYPG